MKLLVSRPQSSIRARLFVLVLVLALPMQLLIVGAVWQMAQRAREAEYGGITYMAQTIRNGLDAHLQRYITVGEGLAKSPAIFANDMSAFRREAERFFPDTSEAWVLVADEHAYQLMNLLFPAGEPPSRRSQLATAAQTRAQDTGQAMVTGVFRGLAAEDWIATIEIPIHHDTSPFRALAIPFRARTVLRLLTAQDVPEGYLVGVIDKEGRFVARTTQDEQKIGQLASEGWRGTIAKEGIFEFPSLEGDPLVQANAVSSVSGWSVGVAVKKEQIDAQVGSTVRLALLFGGAISFASLLLAAAMAKRISEPIRKFASSAPAVVREGGTASLDSSFTSLPELREVWLALAHAVRDRDQYDLALRDQLAASVAAERRQRLLLSELAHRVKNTLAVVQSMAFLTLRSTPNPNDFVDVFSARLAALGRAHNLLVNGAWAGASVQKIVAAAVRPFRIDAESAKFQLSGPEVELSPTATISVSLMLHELATNAVKHGALRTDEGQVCIRWKRVGSDEPPALELHWAEMGGPMVMIPLTEGFGSRLLNSTAVQLKGNVKIDYRPDGLHCFIRFPLQLEDPAELPDINAPPGPQRPSEANEKPRRKAPHLPPSAS